MKKLPLGKLAGDIRAAITSLDEASAERIRQEKELGRFKGMLANIHSGETVDQRATELQDKIQNIESWLTTAAELNRACDRLDRTLHDTAAKVCPLANLQSSYLRAWAAIGNWAVSLTYIKKTPVESRAKGLSKLAEGALTEMAQLQDGQIPMMKNKTRNVLLLHVQFDE